jgi:hypothetical protein
MMQSLPFSAAELDALLDQSGADVLLASSKHNVQYLLGGYRYFFFEHSAAIGLWSGIGSRSAAKDPNTFDECRDRSVGENVRLTFPIGWKSSELSSPQWVRRLTFRVVFVG